MVLRGSDSPCKGRLEVYRKQERQWGLVCPYGWNERNGKVVCKSLGCGDLVHTDKEMSHYKDPPLPKQYFMDQVNCSSEEENLKSCPHVGRNTIDCKKIGFVAVECSGKYGKKIEMNKCVFVFSSCLSSNSESIISYLIIHHESIFFNVGNVELSLNMNGQRDKCAGVVQFKIHNDVIGVCNSKWGKCVCAFTVCVNVKMSESYFIR